MNARRDPIELFFFLNHVRILLSHIFFSQMLYFQGFVELAELRQCRDLRVETDTHFLKITHGERPSGYDLIKKNNKSLFSIYSFP